MLTAKDNQQLQSKGISEDQVQQQILHFQQGFPFMRLTRAATVGDGILSLSNQEVDQAIEYYQNHLSNTEVVKFVPASGAASRMFKELFALMESPDQPDRFPKAVAALKQIEDFSFFGDLKAKLSADGYDLTSLIAQGEFKIPLEYLLTDKGLNYGSMPKGLLAFHRYPSGSRTPMEEHLVEAAHYGRSEHGKSSLHFTVSPEHRNSFNKLEIQKKPQYETDFDLSYIITYSEQKPYTDTIAVDMSNQPFREKDDRLLFRPGGHGALLENLDDIQGDIIFIKNIDNVVPDHLKKETYRYKQALAGVLLQTRSKIFGLLNRIDEGDQQAVSEGSDFLKSHLGLQTDHPQSQTKEYVHAKLNRPIRICGMVKNEGEPGGGPFWTHGKEGAISLQIVEASQIDPEDSEQQKIAQNATHFNPVDLVCGTKDYQGKKFELLQYRDPETGFISHKSKDGRELKALELPGLWNGSMSNWNTVFVEVPAITFNPVKTVNDLLRKEHQPSS